MFSQWLHAHTVHDMFRNSPEHEHLPKLVASFEHVVFHLGRDCFEQN